MQAFAIATTVLSALALYLASPNRGWWPGAGRVPLRLAGALLALASLAGWVAALGPGAGVCAMLGLWMLVLIALPYLAWWTAPRGQQQGRA